MKTKWKLMAILMMATIMFTMIPWEHNLVLAANNMSSGIGISVTMNGFTKAELKWKKQNVSKYKVYSINVNTMEEKLVTTLKGNSTKYIVKTKQNQTYYYRIAGVTGTGKKERILFNEDVVFYVGVSEICWDNYQYFAETTPNSIELKFDYGDGVKADGIQIYRKKLNDKTYKLIKTLKGNKTGYVDKTVSSGETYLYKLRSYKKINGKMVYGRFTEQETMKAVWHDGKFNAKWKMDGDNSIVEIYSDKGNDTAILNLAYSSNAGYDSLENNTVLFGFDSYSEDGKKWTKVEYSMGMVKLKPGKTLYLKFVPESREEYIAYNNDLQSDRLIKFVGAYNNYGLYLYLDTVEKTCNSSLEEFEYYDY